MIVFKAHTKPVYAVLFSPDGSSLLTSGCDEKVCLWSLETVQQMNEWPGSKFWGPIAFSPDGRFVGRGGYGISVWPIQSPNPVLSSRGFAESVSFSPDGKVFAAHGDSQPLARWELSTGNSLPAGWGGTRESTNGRQFPKGALAYHPNGDLLASCFGVMGEGDFDSVIYLWDANTGELRSSLRSQYSNYLTAICFSPDGSLLAGIYGPTLRIWDVENATEIATRQVGLKHFKGLAFTPDGRQLVTVNNDATVRLYDTTSWSETGGFDWKIGKMGAVAVAPDGLRMAAGGSTGKVVIWDVD